MYTFLEMISLSIKIFPIKIKNILKPRRRIYYCNQMQSVPLIGIENVFIFMLSKPIPARFVMIFFYNLLVNLYCFK